MEKIILIIISCFLIYSCNINEKQNTGFNTSSGIDTVLFESELALFEKINNTDSLVNYSAEIIDAYPNQIAFVSDKIAHELYKKSNFNLTKKYFEMSADSYLKDSLKSKYAEQLTNVGVLNEMTGDYPRAIENYYVALSIFNELELEFEKTFIFNNLGIVYQQIGNPDKAIEYYKQSIRICKDLNKINLISSKYNNIASFFDQIHNIDSALFYYFEAYKYSIESKQVDLYPTIEANIANIYTIQGELIKADSLLNEALIKAKGNDRTKLAIFLFKSEVYLKQGKFDEMELYATKLIKLSQDLSFKEYEVKGLEKLIESYKMQNKFEFAFVKLKLLNKINKKLKGIEQIKNIENLVFKYKAKQKDDHIKYLELNQQLTKKRNLIWAVSLNLIILALIVLVYILYIQKKHRELKIINMHYEIANHIKKIHDFEEEIHEQELSHNDLFVEKIKQFNLTEREEEVLLYISEGLKNTEIADKMFVSINTVKTHIKNIFVKLDVSNRIQATNKAKVL
jgi:ATP/maltotriose-dependent transcriptional regulator MalT